MMKLLPVMDLYQIKLDQYCLLNDSITYPVLLINEKYILKRVPSEIVINEVLFSSLIKKHFINEVVFNKYNRIFTYYDSCFWFMTLFNNGTSFEHSNEQHLKEANEFLSKFTEYTPAIGEIEFHDNFSVRQWYQNPSQMIEKTFSLINHYFGEVDQGYRKRILKIFHSLNFKESDYDLMQKSVSHGEYQNTNILFEDEQIKIIDWDSLSIRPRIFDLVSSACYLCRVQRGDFIIDKEKLERYIGSTNFTETEKDNIKNLVFITFVPKEDTIEKFYVTGKNKLRWYLWWTLDAMEKCIKSF